MLQAQERKHPYTLAANLDTVTRVYVWRRETSTVRQQAVWQMTLSREHRFKLERDGMMQHGWALVMQGETASGLAEMQRGFELGGLDRYVEPWYVVLFAEACGVAGKIEEGMGALEQARALVEQSEIRWCEAEIHRLQGELSLAQSLDNYREAECCFHQALSVARRQHAKSLELRAAASLARLWQSQDKAKEAHDLLTPVYGWFTEGFETADLKDARTLLMALEA